MEKIRTLLVDDHKIIRDGIKSILHSDKTIDVVAEANNGAEAIKFLEKNSEDIDVILMDINMPELNGIDATEIIMKLHNNINILALTMHSEETYILKMVKAGALGYVLKESGGAKLIEAVKTVAAGKKYYSNDVSITMINSIVNGTAEKSSKQYNLTSRELEVLNSIVEGNTNIEIADDLCISNRTVDTHRRNILKKLNVRNTAEMVRFAMKEGLVD